MDAQELAGETAIVTGGAQGIGLAVVRLLVERGARVAIIDINEAAAAEVADKLGRERVAVVQGDLKRRQSVTDAFSRAVDALGAVDMLVNNAGTYPRTAIGDLDDEAWDRCFDVNLRGLYHMTVCAAAHMRSRGRGRIVSLASASAYIPYPMNAHYAAAKAGVASLTRSFAMACAPDGVLVNAVAPGATDTEGLQAQSISSPDLLHQIPLRRLALPEDIAEVICFLASPRNRYVTGETVIASGGIVMA